MSANQPPENRNGLPLRLVINQPQFLRQARNCLLDGQQFSIGHVRRRSTRLAQELILDRWQAAASIPNGQERPPMMDWAVMGAAYTDLPSIQAMIAAIRPKRSQMLVVIQLDPLKHHMVPSAIWRDGLLQYPEEIRFIGTQMLTLGAAKQSSPIGPPSSELIHEVAAIEPEIDRSAMDFAERRSSRTRGALGAIYDQLGTQHLVLIGAGGGGHELARQLVAAGVRRLTIIDGDVLGPENLDRMPLARAKNVGQRKVLQLALSLHANQPDVSIGVLPHSVLHPDATRLLRGMRADAIFSYVDSHVARLAVSLLAREMETIHIDVGSTIELGARSDRTMACDVRLFEPGLGCVACVPQMESLDDVLYHLSTPQGCLQRGRRLEWHQQRAGSLLHLNSFASSLAVETWLAWLRGELKTSNWTRTRWEGLVPEVRSAPVGPDSECRFCQVNPIR